MSTETPAAKSVPARSSKRPFVILAVIAVLVGGGWYGWRAYTHGKETTDDAQVESDVVPVGNRVGGTVVKIHVVDNQHVKKGDPIVDLDPADFQARVAQTEAEVTAAHAQADAADSQVKIVEATSRGGLSSAQAQLTGSTTGVRSADAQIEAARATLSRTKSDLAKAASDLARAKKLRADEAIPQMQLDNAQTAFDSAQAATQQAQAQLDSALAQKQSAQSKVAEAKGHVDSSAPIDAQIAQAHANAELAHAREKSAEAQRDEAKLQLSYVKIVAPADGLVSRVSVREGQILAPGQMIVAIVPLETYVVANFKETQVGRMQPGQTADIEIDAFPGKTFHGKVQSLSAATGARFSMLPPDNASGNFVKVVQRVPVKIVWTDAPPATLQAGLSADVTVHVE